MSNIARGKNNWALFLFLLAGIVIGGFISELTAGIPALGWLSYGQRLGDVYKRQDLLTRHQHLISECLL